MDSVSRLKSHFSFHFPNFHKIIYFSNNNLKEKYFQKSHCALPAQTRESVSGYFFSTSLTVKSGKWLGRGADKMASRLLEFGGQ